MRCTHALVVSVDGRKEFVPCGKCNFCLQARRSEWSFRLRQELRASESSHFLTLTYEKAPQENGIETLRKKDLQDFFKRLRKSCPTKIRYYAVGEYGTRTIRPHYHALLFNAPTKFLESSLDSTWSHGHTMIGTVTDSSIHYVTKYHVNKVGDYPGRAPPFVLMSRRPGIGSRYLDTHAKWHLHGLKSFTQMNGFIGRMPRFYADKIFTKEQKQMINSLAPSEREAYFKEIARLSKLGHADPHSHYLERLKAAHDRIVHKENLSNKF